MSIKIYKHWKIHVFTLIYILLSIIANRSLQFLLTLCIVCLHEMGHYLMALYFHFDIDDIVIMPFGAFLSIKDFENHSIFEDCLVTIAGPFVNIIFILVCLIMNHYSYFFIINVYVLCFNCLPIYPMDGSKCLLLALSYIFDYLLCLKIQVYLSVICLILFVMIKPSITYIVIYIYLLNAIYYYYLDIKSIYIRSIIHNQSDHIKINHHYKYYRPYCNKYIIDKNIYSLHQVYPQIINHIDH